MAGADPSEGEDAVLARPVVGIPRSALVVPSRTVRRPPPNAVCEQCRRDTLSRLPTFSAGSGVASRPIADDVFCHYCGHIGLPEYL
jgi:hypothetical protein